MRWTRVSATATSPLQFCSNTAETNIHALRDILKHTPDLLAPRWKIDGFLPPHTIKKLGKETVRNLLGFKDGTANLDASDEQADGRDRLGRAECRRARLDAGRLLSGRPHHPHVRRALGSHALVEQEQIIGREKVSGAPLDDVASATCPIMPPIPRRAHAATAHIRLANPRTPDTQASRILRRGYNYSRGLTSAGQLDMGLLFVCFQADLAAGFLTVQARLNGEPLEEYIKPVGGGYFFVLPGARSPDNFLGEPLLSSPI